MNLTAGKTRNCIEPWRSFQFDATGNITPCCSGTIKGNFGNIVADYFEAGREGRTTDLFLNTDYMELRRGLLTGDLSDSCKTCRSVHDADISTDELRLRVMNHLESQGVPAEGIDLTREYAFSECGGNISNKCNFSCVYCAHSGEHGHAGYYRADMAREHFLGLVELLCGKGLKIFNFCGIGELTIYPDWQRLCREIMSSHPHLRLRLISNFGRELADSELDMLTRFDLIHVSCDTLDEQTYASLRKGGRLPVLLDNIRRLRKKFTGDPARDPRLAFNVTVTDAVADRLEGLFRFAAANGMFVHLSPLFVMHGSAASRTDCVRKITDIPAARAPHVREVFYDLPRRMKAENPLTGVWEYKYLYRQIMNKADAITFNKFVPGPDEAVYRAFHETHPRNQDACLRKLWLSFDDSVKGISISAGKIIKLVLPRGPGKLTFRATWCRDRLDGNTEIIKGPTGELSVAGELTLSALNCGSWHAMLIEVLSYDPAAVTKAARAHLAPAPPEGGITPVLVREAFMTDEEESVARRLAESQEPVVLWCAGLRTLQMLSNTCLNRANIKMIIDGNPSRKGQLFCGRIIHSPEDIAQFSGRIVVMHASAPDQVAVQIRSMGISNEILIL